MIGLMINKQIRFNRMIKQQINSSKMSYVLINHIDSNQDFIQRTQRIYIDPEQLISIKNKRKSFKMVKSIYQPDDYQYGEYDTIDKHQWGSMIKNSSNKHYHGRNLSSPKLLSSNKQSHPDHVTLNQHMQSLHKLIDNTNDTLSPNVQFVWKLLSPSIKKQLISYQQGDCVPLSQSKSKLRDKFLILSGQVNIIGKNQNSFKRKAGYLYFLQSHTRDKIKQIVVLRSTKILKIPQRIYQSVIKPYMSLKLTQRINFIRMCPFFIWNEQFSQDLASCMQLIMTQKQQIIYHSNQSADRIYFVKQGIVLLQRNSSVRNSLVEGYERHYEKTVVSEKEAILVVRKGMVFGVDGVIIKQFDNMLQATVQMMGEIRKSHNEDIYQQKSNSTQLHKATQSSQHSNQRIYSARTLGKCELYVLDKKVLQTLFTMSDIDENLLTNRTQINSRELQRLSLQYMSILADQNATGVNQIPLKRKQIVFNIGDSLQEKSKSLASISSKSTAYIRINKNALENSYKSIIFNKKRTLSQNQQQLQSTKQDQRQEYQRYSLNEEREINEMRNRIRSQRERLRLQSIKKSTSKNQTNTNPLNVIKQLHHLPKIFLKKQLTLIPNPKQSPKKLKLDSIINKKLKQDISIYSNQNILESKIDKLQSVDIEKKVQKSQLVRLLEQQNIKSKSNPSFINVKSYKSIGSMIKLGSEI